MRRLLLVLLVGLFASTSVAQPVPDSVRAPHPLKIVWGFDGGAVLPQGNFRETVGARHGGFKGFFGARLRSGFGFGVHLAHSQLQTRSETATLDSGLDVDLKTTTSITRVGLFGQFGPRFGSVRPYGEGVVGINVLGTDTKIPGNSRGPENRKTHRESVAPAAGLAVGVEIGLGRVVGGNFALRIEGRRTYGGTADYLLYSREEGEFVERSSGTTTSSFRIGVTLNY